MSNETAPKNPTLYKIGEGIRKPDSVINGDLGGWIVKADSEKEAVAVVRRMLRDMLRDGLTIARADEEDIDAWKVSSDAIAAARK